MTSGSQQVMRESPKVPKPMCKPVLWGSETSHGTCPARGLDSRQRLLGAGPSQVQHPDGPSLTPTHGATYTSHGEVAYALLLLRLEKCLLLLDIVV